MIDQTKIPLFEFMDTENTIITFKIGKLKSSSNNDFQCIQNVKIEISEKIILTFKDPENLIKTNWKEYDFSGNHVETYDYGFKYKGFGILFKDLHVVKSSSDNTKEAIARKMIITKGEISNESEVKVWELIDRKFLRNGTFEHDNFKIDISSITNQEIKEKYNAEYSFSYECKYNELEEWGDFIWKVFLMLRFYTANLLFPQTEIIMDNFNNFEIIFNGFKSYGERTTIFKEPYNTFSKFLKTSFEIFNENWEFYNLLFTYWTNLDDKRFVEIRNLSGFVAFEVLVKNILSSNKGEFPDKLYHTFNSQNFDLKFFNELFFKEIIDELKKICQIYLPTCDNKELASKTFEFYEINFILFYIQYYRNTIVHDGEIDFKENIVPKILEKIHKKLEKRYLQDHELPRKNLSDFEMEHRHIEGSYWEGFRKGFKIGNEQKNRHSHEYTEDILPIITDIYETLTTHFKENIIAIMDPLDAFDRIITIFLLKLLDIDCTLQSEPKFYINGRHIHESKEYISNFIKSDNA